LSEPVDVLLADVAIRIQLSRTDYRKAEERYAILRRHSPGTDKPCYARPPPEGQTQRRRRGQLMSDGEHPGVYSVGYGRPPEHSKWRKGRSGNPKGRPRKQNGPVDVTAILEEGIVVNQAGKPRRMQPFELAVRQLLKQGIVERKVKALVRFLKLCEQYGQLRQPKPEGGVIWGPSHNFYEWFDDVTEPVPPDDLTSNHRT
jgi:hypothetical protein